MALSGGWMPPVLFIIHFLLRNKAELETTFCVWNRTRHGAADMWAVCPSSLDDDACANLRQLCSRLQSINEKRYLVTRPVRCHLRSDSTVDFDDGYREACSRIHCVDITRRPRQKHSPFIGLIRTDADSYIQFCYVSDAIEKFLIHFLFTSLSLF